MNNIIRAASSRILSRLGRLGERPPGEVYYVYLLCLLVGYFAADLLTLNYRDQMLPTKAPPARPVRNEVTLRTARTDYDSILSRDPFNADGLIPDPIGTTSGGQDNAPVLTSLPIQLIGTLVHANPRKSVVTVSASGSKISSYQVGDEIEGLARIERIERNKMIFRNLNNSRLEYAEIKNEMALVLGVKNVPGPSQEIQVEGNNVTVKRSEVLKQTANLSDVLNQASAVPNFGPGGRINGYRLVNIMPGSVYEKMGLRRFDVIKGVNGEPVDSPAKAMELYNQLKTSNGIGLQIERNGADETMNFSITE